MDDEKIIKQQESLTCLGVNVSDAVLRFGGKYELYIKSLKTFAADIIANGIYDLDCATQMEAENLRKYVHGLKGVTANLSIVDINLLLIEIEQSIKAGRTDFEKYQFFCDIIRKRCQEITDLLGADEVPAVSQGHGTADECRAHLKVLNKFLLMGKAKESEEIVVKLREKLWENTDNDTILKICNAVDGYDYAVAMETIDNVR